MTLQAITPMTRVACCACGLASMPLAEAIEHFESREHLDSLIRLNLHADSPDAWERS